MTTFSVQIHVRIVELWDMLVVGLDIDLKCQLTILSDEQFNQESRNYINMIDSQASMNSYTRMKPRPVIFGELIVGVNVYFLLCVVGLPASCRNT